MAVKKETQDLIAAYWDERSAGFDEEHDTEDLKLWAAELDKLIGLDGNGRVLDVGCGTGFLAMLSAGLGYETAGIDISGEMLELGRQKAAVRNLSIRYDQCPCESIFNENDTFDAIVNCRVMWTLQDPEAAVREWIRVLKPGGKVISFMRMMDMSGGRIAEIYGEEIDFPLRSGDRKAYCDVYERAGLRDIRVIELPEELSSSDMPHWTAFVGVKA